MTAEERGQKLKSYANGYAQLAAAIQQFPKESWSFKPSPQRWSIREILVHVVDSEVNGFVRCRAFIAEPGKTVMAYDQDQWAKALRYQEQSVEDALELFKWIRLTTYKLIQPLPDSVWSNTVQHPERGTITFDNWLEIYERHVPAHVRQMQKNYEAWKSEH